MRRRLQFGRDLHDAFQHVCYGRGGETVIAVAALLLDGQESHCGHAGQMAARGLRRDAGDMRQLRGREGAAVHQGLQHSGPGRITRDRCDLCKPGIAGHD